MYRFRSIENLIGKYQELEKQEIYFAALDELNDPMEGKRRYFWQGDKIVWENFLKHYLLCLDHVIFLSRLRADDETFTKEDIPIFKSESNLPTDAYKERIQKINKSFFSRRLVQAYVQFLSHSSNKFYPEDMYVHMKMLSISALNVINEIDIQSGLTSNSVNTNPSRKDMEINLLNHLSGELDSNLNQKLIELLHDVLKMWDSELLLQYKDSPKLQSIYVEFPQMYLDSVIKLTYPDAYVACFMDNCSNSSIWGTYGNSHTGVCLKFKTNDESNPTLSLKSIVGYSSTNGYHYDYRNFPLKQIDYSSNFDELDFFQNIGRLTIRQLKEQWYTDERGNLSICGESMFSNENGWREQYWSLYESAYFKKLPVWAHEREYRIVISSMLNTFDKLEHRLLKYKFDDLEAIIFGMNTPKEARIEIMRIIRNKCKELGRSQFEFFEMAYSNIKHELYPRKLLSLNFNKHRDASS
ncbi:DUF2971 domain-containing protein [Priestia megaterium]